jgi:hypothetical protein
MDLQASPPPSRNSVSVLSTLLPYLLLLSTYFTAQVPAGIAAAARNLALLRCSYVSRRQHTSAYVSLRQLTSAYRSIRQHTSAATFRLFADHLRVFVQGRAYVSSLFFSSLPSHTHTRTHTPAHTHTHTHTHNESETEREERETESKRARERERGREKEEDFRRTTSMQPCIMLKTCYTLTA